jgi:hypothetical protein
LEGGKGVFAQDEAFGGGTEIVAASSEVEVGGLGAKFGDKKFFDVEIVGGGIRARRGERAEGLGEALEGGLGEELFLGEHDDLGLVLEGEKAVEAGVRWIDGLGATDCSGGKQQREQAWAEAVHSISLRAGVVCRRRGTLRNFNVTVRNATLRVISLSKRSFQ